MRREPVLFGGEVSGHYYFADNYNADSGFIPALLILELLSQQGGHHGRAARAAAPPLLHLAARSTRTVEDVAAALRRVEARFADGDGRPAGRRLGRLPDWHFNVRPSNTEPLVRLNLGADSAGELMEEKRDLVLGVIRAG